MASSESSSTEVRVVRTTRKYRWPALQLNFWLLIMLISSCTLLGINSSFLTVQNQLNVGVPWYFPYWIAVSCLTILFLALILWLINQRSLLPGIVILGAFVLFVLWLVGLIVTSLELWGPTGNVNTNCSIVVSGNPITGTSINTLAWLEQHSICQSWQAVFAFALVGTIFLLWIMIMSYNVYQGDG